MDTRYDIKWQCYAQAFSRKPFVDILEYDDYGYLNWLMSQYDYRYFDSGKTYLNYLSYLYKQLVHNYRNEYVYKNEIINQWLLKKYGTKNTMYINEYKVGNSIVDLALFNGESKAFEIKSDMDNPARLEKQMQDYCRVFDKCYIVVPYDKKEAYRLCVDPKVGIIVLQEDKGKIFLIEDRPAVPNDIFDKKLFMQSMRTDEYCSIIRNLLGTIPECSIQNWYIECQKLFVNLPDEDVKREFLRLVKKRRGQTKILRKYPAPIRQMLLSLNLSDNKRSQLKVKLNMPISTYVLSSHTC